MLKEYSSAVTDLGNLIEVSKRVIEKNAINMNVSQEVVAYMMSKVDELINSDNKVKVTPKSTRSGRSQKVLPVKKEKVWNDVKFEEYDCEYCVEYPLTYGYAIRPKHSNSIIGSFNGQECHPLDKDDIQDIKLITGYGFVPHPF